MSAARHAAVQVLAYDEPDLDTALDGYAACTVPSGWTIDYHACVTPRDATHHSIRHHRVDIAREHPVFEYVETPKGKLASRNYAHDLAVEQGADVVLAGDADAPPLHDDYLERVLAHFDDPDVVAVNARPVSPGVSGVAINTVTLAEDVARPHMNGQGHALRADAWLEAGPFDESAEADFDVNAVRSEEEFDFRRRLDAYGTVVDALDAQVRNDTRRSRCQYIERPLAALGREPSDFCKRIGTDAFAPGERWR